MKAIVFQNYGPPEMLQLKEVDRPIPKDNEVLIKVRATTVSAADYSIRGFKVLPGMWLPARFALGLFKPRKSILGAELAGEVTAVGRGVTKFKVGDRVFGLDSSKLGAYAEYVCRSQESTLALMPANLSFDEAAAVPHGALAALFFLRDKGGIQKGHDVLINGASGAVGTAAVQLAKHFGTHVTGVCSTANLEMVKSLGADRVIDYTTEDFTESGGTYDIIFDTVGKTSFSSCKGLLKKGGKYLLTLFDWPQVIQMLWTAAASSKKVICAIAPERYDDLIFIKELVEEGRLTPVIDRFYRFEEMVEAHRYSDSGHKKGSVVIRLDWGE